MVEELSMKCLKEYGTTALRHLDSLRSGLTIIFLSAYCPAKLLTVSVGEWCIQTSITISKCCIII